MVRELINKNTIKNRPLTSYMTAHTYQSQTCIQNNSWNFNPYTLSCCLLEWWSGVYGRESNFYSFHEGSSLSLVTSFKNIHIFSHTVRNWSPTIYHHTKSHNSSITSFCKYIVYPKFLSIIILYTTYCFVFSFNLFQFLVGVLNNKSCDTVGPHVLSLKCK